MHRKFLMPLKWFKATQCFEKANFAANVKEPFVRETVVEHLERFVERTHKS